jgi:hypothetical protein
VNTALVSLALAGILSAPSWQTSYVDAQQNAVAQRKPLAVVFGPGTNGWSKIVSSESPAPEVSKLLKDQYVCVYVDTDTQAGKQFARNFEIAGDRGLVISDRSGSMQAFWHQGDLPNDSLTRYLTKYADPNLVVAGTETVMQPRTSYYPAQGYYPPQNFAPIRAANC